MIHLGVEFLKTNLLDPLTEHIFSQHYVNATNFTVVKLDKLRVWIVLYAGD